MMAPILKLFIFVGWGRSFLSVAWSTGIQLVFFFLLHRVSETRFSIVGQLSECVESSFLIHHGGYHDLYVCPC